MSDDNPVTIDVFEAGRELAGSRGGRLVVVLGYSDRRTNGLHPICAARLETAARVAEGARAVVLSGWARGRVATPEAELMLRAWAGPEVPLVCDPHSRVTAENAAHAVALANELCVDRVVVVTSTWHRRRARMLFQALLRGSGARLELEVAAGPSSRLLVGRELVSVPLVPAQLLIARRGRRPATARDAGGGEARGA
jgi:uncharacterized SAM-binding protein YcdF (DUF218 family)